MVSYKIFIFITMIFMHILEDFHLQGCLANLKQKDWWEKNVANLKDTIYARDYAVALITHSIENSIFVVMPIVIDNLIYMCKNGIDTNAWKLWAIFILLNTAFHTFVDSAKCNKKIINLVVDQVLHFAMLIMMFVVSWKYLGLWLI